MRWILRIAGVLVLLAIVAVAALFLLPADRIAGIAAERFEAATGRTLSVRGDIRPTLWPSLGISIGEVEIGNADWSTRGPMLTAGKLSVAVDWSALFGGDIRVQGVEIDRPSILLEAREGGGNWVFAPAGEGQTQTGGAGAARGFALDTATIRDGRVTFVAADGTETVLSGLDATLALPDYQGRASLEAGADLNGQPVRLNGSIDGFAGFLAAGAVPVALDAGIGGGEVSFQGLAGLAPLAATGRATGEFGTLEKLFATLGRPAPELPQGLGREKTAFSADLTFAEDRISLRDATATLDGNRFGGEADVALGGVRPRVTARIDAGALDLSALGGEDGAGKPAETSEGWSTEPIDASGLSAIDGEISFAAESIRLGSSTLGRTRLFSTIDNSRLETQIRELKAYDGEVAGSFVVNNRNGLSVRTDLSGSAIAISRLFSELFEYDRLIALGDMTISVLGSGPSQAAILNSLNGQGSFSFGAGELLGFDLVGILTHLDTKYMGVGSKTIFDSITGTFRIVDGVVINEDLTFLAPLLTATGKGEVGIGGQTLNYRLVPQLRSGDNSGLKVPLTITGTWAEPKFRLDLEAIAKEKFGEKTKALEEKAKEAAREKAAGKLGIAPAEGQSSKDAVKDKLKEEAAKGLLNLLNR